MSQSIITKFAEEFTQFLDEFVSVQKHPAAEMAIMRIMRRYGTLLGDPADEK